MHCLIYLQSEVDAFTIRASHFEKIKMAFPLVSFTHVQTEQDFRKYLPTSDVVVTWIFKDSWYPIASKLRAIFTPAAGHDWIASNCKYQVPVFYGSFHGALMSESLLAMILYFNRNTHLTIANQRKHIWDRNLLSTTRTLRVQKIAIIGFGAIGRECAAILKAMGAKVVGIKHSSYDPWLDKNTDAIYHPEYLSKAIEDCDHVVSILPGTKDNDNIIDKRVFSSMKNGSFFYSIGRGNSCDEMDLIWALKNGIIAGAGLDVFAEEPLPANSELWNLSNVLITPHSSAICSEYMDLYASELNVKLKPFLEQFTRKLSESDKTCF
jgi:phosphoglycerate dehydrogenase-like enzyme